MDRNDMPVHLSDRDWLVDEALKDMHTMTPAQMADMAASELCGDSGVHPDCVEALVWAIMLRVTDQGGDL